MKMPRLPFMQLWTIYLFIVYLEVGSLDDESCIVLPRLKLLEQVDEGAEDQAVVLVHRSPSHHLLHTTTSASQGEF